MNKIKQRYSFFFRADSITWNPHKLMGALLQCSTIHFKEDVSNINPFSEVIYLFFLYQGLLMSCNQMSADYLFMQDKLYDIRYDTGDKVIQCGRHNDIFKLWLQWRAKVSTNILKKCSFLRTRRFPIVTSSLFNYNSS